MTPDKIQKHKLKDFLKLYNYYINKLLIGKSDPFIEKQNRIYLRRREADSLLKLRNVFARLVSDPALQTQKTMGLRRRDSFGKDQFGRLHEAYDLHKINESKDNLEQQIKIFSACLE